MVRKQKTIKKVEEKKDTVDTKDTENIIKEIKEDIEKSQVSTPEVSNVSKTEKKVEEPIKKTTRRKNNKKEDTKQEDIKQEDIKQTEEVVEKQEETKEEKLPEVQTETEEIKEGGKVAKGKRKFTIYYDGKRIPGTYVSGMRPKQAATKAIGIILKRFYTTDKQIQKEIIGKEIKFYLEETIEKNGETKITNFYYKGFRNYIITDQNKDQYTKRGFTLKTDNEGVTGIVAKHKTKSGEIKEIIHKYINKVYVDKETSKIAKEEKKQQLKEKLSQRLISASSKEKKKEKKQEKEIPKDEVQIKKCRKSGKCEV